MRGPATLLGTAGSLRRGLVLNIIAALSLCTLLAGAVMVYEFYEHLEDSLEVALTDEALEIIGQIDPAAPQMGLNNDALRFRGVEGAYRYTVFGGDGSVIAGGEASQDVWTQLAETELGHPQTVNLPGDRIGIALRSRVGGHDVIAMVSTYPPGKENTQFQMLLHEIEEQTIWLILGVIVVLTAAIYAARRALAPLDRLSQQAARIGPAGAHQRLTTGGVPTEMTPLITSINGAFDRLEAGYQAQRDFSSNVAHEVRTPIAVLRSSVDRIEDPALKESLIHDVTQLDQMFQQLIDLARADAVPEASLVQVDLHDLAVDIACEMAQAALRSGHTLSVTGASQAAVRGNPGLLRIALRNVIRNALQYAPKGGEVEIEVLAHPPGWQVLDRGPGVPDALKTALFERFNRGAQANASSAGAGIGLAIVASVAKSHGAVSRIYDRDAGGSVFAFIFENNTGDFSENGKTAQGL